MLGSTAGGLWCAAASVLEVAGRSWRYLLAAVRKVAPEAAGCSFRCWLKRWLQRLFAPTAGADSGPGVPDRAVPTELWPFAGPSVKDSAGWVFPCCTGGSAMPARRKRLQPRFHLDAQSPSSDLDAAFVELLDHLGHDLAREHLRLVESSDPFDGDPSDSVHRED